MIGKHQIIIDASDIVKGMSSGPNVADGGFSNETTGINPLAVVGVGNAPCDVVDSDTDLRLSAGIIASSPDMTQVSSINRLLIDASGNAYRYNGTKITAAAVALTAGKTWTSGFTDIITFGGEAYVTSKEAITRWDNSDVIDAGADFPFAFTTSTVPHPALVYENNAYYGDKNLLLRQTAIGVAPTTILTLDASYIIIALGIDMGTGLMLISAINTLDVSDTLTSINTLFWYDGNSAKWSKMLLVDEPIYSFHSIGGTTFVGYGLNLGYINGSGVSFLRKLKNVTRSNTELPSKQRICSIANTLYVADGSQVLAFGEILRGRKVFYYATKNWVNSNKYDAIFPCGSGKLGLAFATKKFYTFDTNSIADTATGSFYSNRYYFPRPVFIRSARIEWAVGVATGISAVGTLYLLDDQGVTTNFSTLQNTSAGTVYEIETKALNKKVTSAQFNYDWTNSVVAGFRRIVISYDVAE